MLFLFIKFLYIIILSFSYGHTIQRLLGQQSSSFSLTALSGLFGISVISACLSLFMPLDILAQGIILFLGVAGAVFYRKSLSFPREFSWVFIIATVYVVYLSAQQSFTYDEGLYYAQFIKWMQS